MARVDSILSIVVQHGANELRMGTDREPKMLAFGAPKKLSLAPTPDAALRALLGDILSPEREATLRADGSVEVDHDAGALGPFVASFAKHDDGFDVVFLRGKGQHDAKPVASVLQSGGREGMITLERSLAERVQSGMVREEHARAAANDPTSFTTYLGR